MPARTLAYWRTAQHWHSGLDTGPLWAAWQQEDAQDLALALKAGSRKRPGLCLEASMGFPGARGGPDLQGKKRWNGKG